jgi:hypothetical protein
MLYRRAFNRPFTTPPAAHHLISLLRLLRLLALLDSSKRLADDVRCAVRILRFSRHPDGLMGSDAANEFIGPSKYR